MTAVFAQFLHWFLYWWTQAGHWLARGLAGLPLPLPRVLVVRGWDVPTFTLFAVSGLVLGSWVAYRQLRDTSLTRSGRVALILVVLACGLFASRVAGGVVNHDLDWFSFESYLQWSRFALVLPAGVVGGLAGVWWFCSWQEVQPGQVLDRLVPAFFLAYALGIWGDGALGAPTQVGWGVPFGPGRMHPFQAYACAGSLFFWLCTSTWCRRVRFEGQNAIQGLILLGAGRWLLDFWIWREPWLWSLSLAQVSGIVLTAGGYATLYIVNDSLRRLRRHELSVRNRPEESEST